MNKNASRYYGSLNGSVKLTMLNKVLKIRKLIGNTPLVNLETNRPYNLFAKLEYNNFSGSIKDRAANNILYKAIEEDIINQDTTIVESSSGNFGVSLALQCKKLGLDFIVVVDPNINKTNLKMLKLFATKVVMVNQPDETGGYLLTRIEKVKRIVRENDNHFWTNQYENENNFRGYKQMAKEIGEKISRLDYLFVATSSCGTLTGLSKYLKPYFPSLKIVGVDIKGSLIFSEEKSKRYISGLGAGRKATFLKEAYIDDVIILNHREIISGCHAMLEEHSIFVGGSSGACYTAATQYLDQLSSLDPSTNCLIICPDRGMSYIDNIYNQQWIEKVTTNESKPQLNNKTDFLKVKNRKHVLLKHA